MKDVNLFKDLSQEFNLDVNKTFAVDFNSTSKMLKKTKNLEI
jgi:hypothetical protein